MHSANSQSGSVFFYIFISIALFAMLSFAVTRMMQGGGSGPSTELKKLAATEILQYADSVLEAVRVMRIDGLEENAICFHTPQWGNNSYSHSKCVDTANNVFDPEGGGIIWEKPPTDSNDGSPWLFTGANGVTGIGTTCAAAGCADLKMVLPHVKKVVCLAINDELKITNPGGEPPEDSGYDATPFTGTYAHTGTGDLGDEAGSSDLARKTAGCFKASASPDAGEYYFYRVLLSR